MASEGSDNAAFDVILVGLGPVGATAAILFAEAGLRVAAIERDEEVYRLPRAVNLDGEIVRAFQRMGRGEAVAALMQQKRPGERVGFTNSRREWLFGTPVREFGSNGWQPMNMFDQPELEGFLRSEAVNHANVTAYIGFEASGLQGDGEQVRITASPNGGGEPERLCGRYLVACDGASSSTRKLCGIGWESLGYDHDWLVVDVTLKDGHTLDLDTVQVCDPGRLATYVCTKDPYRRWEFRLNEGETAEHMLDPETIQSLIDPWTPRGTYDIRRAAVYQFHAATADRWRVGNIFIAGDAAHQTPPFLGQGMNAGMRDVINLAWKLPLVLAGLADDELLDTYHAERDAHARDLVEWAVAIGRLMEHLAEVERAEREGRTAPETPLALRSSGYGQGRDQPPLRDGAVMLDQVGDSSSTGHLFSQPIVCDGEGNECRLDELLGDGFSLVVRTGGDLKISEPSPAILSRLGATTVTLEELQAVRGHFDRLFGEHAAALVRPDRIVFGHATDSADLDGLIDALAQKLTLTTTTRGGPT
ncbi:MAG: bifunctional 3-(3-hydroxy-phenyl)propionate/3-hydroxycinnamic acid hydroxylase [Acidimicrobiia bacterium]|nr:bifunctional 3-(3-hydroxy-phenyl)propionate/3-hydroxycinnamic acid hydroxylase [Acidimicrobiia bacterium]